MARDPSELLGAMVRTGPAEQDRSRMTAHREIRRAILIADSLHGSVRRATMYVADAPRSDDANDHAASCDAVDTEDDEGVRQPNGRAN